MTQRIDKSLMLMAKRRGRFKRLGSLMAVRDALADFDKSLDEYLLPYYFLLRSVADDQRGVAGYFTAAPIAALNKHL